MNKINCKLNLSQICLTIISIAMSLQFILACSVKLDGLKSVATFFENFASDKFNIDLQF